MDVGRITTSSEPRAQQRDTSGCSRPILNTGLRCPSSRRADRGRGRRPGPRWSGRAGGSRAVASRVLQQQQVELETAPTTDLVELGENLRAWRQAADERARSLGARVAALATSPLPVVPQLTPNWRYQVLTERYGLTAMEQLTCGCHVHVSVEDDDDVAAYSTGSGSGSRSCSRCRPTPRYWQGRDTGYASFRSQAWTRFPTAGPTEIFDKAATYQERTEALVDSGVLLDHGMIYFDARLSHKFPTVEIRVADVCLYAEDSVLIAGLARALVETAARDAADGRPPPPVPAEPIRLATWRAGKSALYPAICWTRTAAFPGRRRRCSMPWSTICDRPCTTPGTRIWSSRVSPGTGTRGRCIHPAPARRIKYRILPTSPGRLRRSRLAAGSVSWRVSVSAAPAVSGRPREQTRRAIGRW